MSNQEPGNHSSGDEQREPDARECVETREEKRGGGRTRLILIGTVIIAALVGLLVLGIVPRLRRNRGNADAAREAGRNLPVVTVVRAERASASADLELPGNIEPVQVTTILARTSGYLKRWRADIGDRVRAGQLLAEIDTPEVEQEVEQARANLNQARAGLGQTEANLHEAETNAELARVTYERYHYLVGQGVVTKQDTDQRLAAYNAAQATVNARQADVRNSQAAIKAQEANVKRLVDLQGYQKVYAPFSGVITARFVDTGSLIGASSTGAAPSTTTAAPSTGSGGTGQQAISSASGSNPTPSNSAGGALFSIARIDTLRVFLNVPQAFIGGIHSGENADVSVRELPNEKFTGRIVRTTEALDPATRTLLTEVRVDNRDYHLLPGMYAVVKFAMESPSPPIRVPSSALIVRSEGTLVATVSGDHKIHLKKVDLGRDYGKTIDVVNGLDDGEQLVIDPVSSLQEGTNVEVKEATQGNRGGESTS